MHSPNDRRESHHSEHHHRSAEHSLRKTYTDFFAGKIRTVADTVPLRPRFQTQHDPRRALQGFPAACASVWPPNERREVAAQIYDCSRAGYLGQHTVNLQAILHALFVQFIEIGCAGIGAVCVYGQNTGSGVVFNFLFVHSYD